jgi:ATP-dependent RNA helicase RhlE
VSHVFNFELPNVPEQYVHRIGRTARAGADGVAISFCAPDEKPYLRDIERLTKVKPDVMPLPENFLADAARLPAPARRPAGEENEARRDQPRGRAGGGRRDGGRQDGARHDAGRRDGGRRDGGRPERRDDRSQSGDRVQGERAHGDRARGERTGQDRGRGGPRPEGGRSDGGRSEAARHDAGGEAAAKRRFRPRGPATTGQHRNKVRRVV